MWKDAFGTLCQRERGGSKLCFSSQQRAFIGPRSEGDPAQHLIQEVLLRAANKYGKKNVWIFMNRWKYHKEIVG
ncbi:hypothetical protein DY000_02010568, partial [Brassica cretica]